MNQQPRTEPFAEPLLEIRDVAQWLGISPSSVYRRLREGKLVGSKIGGQWRISRGAVMQFIEDGINVDRH